MKHRTVVMHLEISCFVSCLCGWILVCSTLPTESWTVSTMSETVQTTGLYFSNLWRDCVSDSTGVSDCKDYPSLLALPVFLHTCRALAVCAVITGFFGCVLALIGMKCTKIGGSEIANARVTFAGGLTYLASGFCALITYSWWASKAITEFLDPNFIELKFEIGVGVYVGWGGSLLLIGGGAVLTYITGKDGLPSSSSNRSRRPAIYTIARTRRTYMQPATTSRVTLIPPLFYEGKRSRATRTAMTTRTGRSFPRDSFV